MNKDFVELMKTVAKSYGATIIEAESKGGVFYKNSNGELIELTPVEHSLIVNDFLHQLI